MSLHEVTRSATFRLAASFSAAFAVSCMVLFALIFLQTTVFETNRIDDLLRREALTIARESERDIIRDLGNRLANDLHRISFAALFEADGTLVAGNLKQMPADLPIDGQAHGVTGLLLDDGDPITETVRAVSLRVQGGRVIVLGRNIAELNRLRTVVLRALEVGLIPAVLLALLVGGALSLRTMGHLKKLHTTLERIMAGHLDERLPAVGRNDDLNNLTASVNRMLDEIVRLLGDIRGVSDNIAHDLKAPLTRLRTRLDRARSSAGMNTANQELIDKSIADLDHAFTLISALLRTGEIKSGDRRALFTTVSIAAIAQDIGELYQPLAEAKDLAFAIEAHADALVFGDRDLLMEAIANLLDNAIKYTPEGGAVTLRVEQAGQGVSVSVSDTGPGIPPAERAHVLKPFYRSGSSRHIPGNGIGLSLVAAIVELHGFSLAMRDGHPGFVFEISMQPAGAAPLGELPASLTPLPGQSGTRRLLGAARIAGSGLAGTS